MQLPDIPGYHTYNLVSANNIQVPAVVFLPVDRIEYATTIYTQTRFYTAYVLVQSANPVNAYTQLDEAISSEHLPQLIRDTVPGARVISASQFDMYSMGGGTYFGYQIEIQIVESTR